MFSLRSGADNVCALPATLSLTPAGITHPFPSPLQAPSKHHTTLSAVNVRLQIVFLATRLFFHAIQRAQKRLPDELG